MFPSFVGCLIRVFLVIVVTVGLIKIHEDFTIGGRNYGTWVVALSAKASDGRFSKPSIFLLP